MKEEFTLIEKTLKKYNDMSVPVKAAFWFTICSFMQKGISMITTPIFTRLLSKEEYGLYSTYLSWETVAFMVITLSLHKSMMNLYVKYDNKELVLSSVCGLELVLTGTWLVIGVLFQNKLSQVLGISSELVCCLFIYCMAQAVFHCWSLYKRYIYDYRKLIAVTLLNSVGASVLGVIAVVGIRATAVSRAVSSVAVLSFIGVILYISIFKKNKTFCDKKIWAFSLGFCIPLMPHYLSEFILQSSDKLMINYMCGSEDVAVYSIAYSIGNLIGLVNSAINASFAPYQYQQMQAKNYKRLANSANKILLFVAVVLGGLMLFSREIVLIFGGTKYIESADVIVPICIGVFFNYLFQLFARVQEYYERKLTIVIPSLLCAILNIILNYIFIGLYGYQAAAYTTFICYLIFCIVHYLFYKGVCNHELKGEQIYDMKSLSFISITVILCGFAMLFINKMLWLKYTIITVAAIIMLIKRNSVKSYIKNMF